MSDTQQQKVFNIALGVEQKVAAMLDARTIDLLPGYPWRNALKAAWLRIQDQTAKFGEHKGQLVLAFCTPSSVANALLDMVVQGLDPTMEQVDFIPYDVILTCSRSRWGDEALAQRLGLIVGGVATQPIYAGDVLEFEILDGRYRILKHVQTFESLEKGDVTGAYAIGTLPTGEKVADIMTKAQIQASWSMGRNTRSDRPHLVFEGEMAKRTVARRFLKPLLNAAVNRLDPQLAAAITRSDEDAEHEATSEAREHEVAQLATAPVLTFDDVIGTPAPAAVEEDVVDADSTPVPVPVPVPAREPEPVPVPVAPPAAQPELLPERAPF